MSEIDLKPFCATEPGPGSYSLEEPFVARGFEYATDGKIIVRRPTVNPDTTMTPANRTIPQRISAFFEWKQPVTLHYPEPFYEGQCANCDGLGQVTCETCGHTKDCNWCLKTGKRHVRIGTLPVGITYDRLIRKLPDVHFAEQADPRSVIFRSGDLQGFLMAMVEDK